MARQALGKGLGALIKRNDNQKNAPDTTEVEADRVILAKAEEIMPSPFQPRRHFNEEQIAELADSIRERGLVQPLVVRRVDGKYELKTVILTGPETYNADRGYYSFTFYGLLASELRTVVDVAVYEGETQLGETLRYSAESYAATNQIASLIPLCKALFAYSDSAKAYFAK